MTDYSKAIKIQIEIEVVPIDEVTAQAFNLTAIDVDGQVAPMASAGEIVPASSRAVNRVVNEALFAQAEAIGIEVVQTNMVVRHAVDGVFPEMVWPSMSQRDENGDYPGSASV
jgi:hypothetical protein